MTHATLEVQFLTGEHTDAQERREAVKELAETLSDRPDMYVVRVTDEPDYTAKDGEPLEG